VAEEKEYDLIIPPGTPNMEVILSEVIEKFGLKLVSSKHPDDPYYLAVRGNLQSVQAAKEYIKKRLEEMVKEMEKNYGR